MSEPLALKHSIQLEKLEKELKELKWKVKALTNFIYQHHHKITTHDNVDYRTSKPKVWVQYEDGCSEEPKESE